jgi:hypothetical protein
MSSGNEEMRFRGISGVHVRACIARKIAVSPLLSAAFILATSATFSASAEESAGGHYIPGATADFLDALPGTPGALSYMNVPYFYDGSRSRSRGLDFGGVIALDVSAQVRADTSLLLYETEWRFLGAEYAVGVAIPWVSVEVSGTVQPGRFARLTRRVNDKAEGLGDIQLIPIMLGWQSGDLKWGTNFSIYAPTGEFEAGRLANVGKNFWTFEPSANISYLSTTNGIEATAFAGIDFNTENTDTDYQSGEAFHLDVTLAQHLPLFGGIAGIGANGFYYQQLTGDSGSGAVLGSFKGQTLGVGPVVSYVYRIEGATFLSEVKWLPELAVENRLKGDGVFVKVGFSAQF